MSIKQLGIIEFPKIMDPRGNLTFIEGDQHIPFHIRRCYWIYDVPGGETRGGHAYRSNNEIIDAVSGSFDVVIDDGNGQQTFSLNRSYYGLYVPCHHWRELVNFSTNSLSLVMASDDFSEKDYIRSHDDFLLEVRAKHV